MIQFSTKTQRWTLVDRNGQPVVAGQHVTPDGRQFTLSTPIDVVTIGSLHQAKPTRLMVSFNAGDRYAHPSELGSDWHWSLT